MGPLCTAITAKLVDDLAVDSAYSNLGRSTCRRRYPRQRLLHSQAFRGLVAEASGWIMSQDWPPKRRWTQTDISQLRREVAHGATIETLATSLARDPEEVFRMASRLNVIIAASLHP